MSTRIEDVIASLTDALSSNPSVSAIGVSTRTFPRSPDDGDVDLFVYTSRPLADDERHAAYALVPFSSPVRHVFESDHWGSGERTDVDGIEIWIMYFTESEAHGEFDAICAGLRPGNDNGYYATGRLAMYQCINILFERHGFLSGLQAALRVYPTGLKEATIIACTRALDDEEDLLRAVARSDLLFYHVSVDQALDQLLQLLFAVNEKYFPGRKRTREHVAALPRKPDEFLERVRNVIRLGADEATLVDSLDLLRVLRRETLGLVDLWMTGAKRRATQATRI